MRVLVMLGRRPADAEQAAWYRDTAEKVYRQVLGLVERQTGQSRELLREKGEANISLSRNLGHDLTNIIATNKLELMTVRSLLDGDPSTWFDHAEKIAILKESLTCLLDNTRSLQQIVNLYRAYEHLKSPRYERTEINPLIEELIAIFHLSMSAPVDIVCDFAKGLPCVEIEPRLVKLALFNLLSNAQDAIRRLPPEEQSGARIVVQTLADPSRPDVVTVRVSDTGPGIRTPDGSLAAAEEIDRVFELGYTTKGSEGGEGIGLNWVRTILTEFHPSELIAYNRPQGGATFQFRLPAARNATESLASKEGPGR
jgi:signal transduction histidine kinase